MAKTNVIILHADQHRQDCIGAYGNKDVKTPNIDSLASDGVKYDNHYTVYPVCTPARYSFVSGLYVHQHAAWSNESTLPSGIATFPSVLKENGYKTTAVGKMHFTPTYQDVGYEKMILAEQNGEGRYEDDYHTYLMNYGLIDRTDLVDQVESVRKRAGKKYFDNFGAFTSDLDQKHHSTTWITKQAINEINRWDAEGGNLLMVGYIKPHHPFDPPKPYDEMYEPMKLTFLDGYTQDVPRVDYEHQQGFFDNKTLNEYKLRRVMANYYGIITQIDDNIGKILEMLKEKGLYEDTLIIYTSDHGEYMGFHHMLLKGNYLYDPLAKIPLIIKYPKAMGKQGVTDEISLNIDIASTILDVCQQEKPATISGLNLANYNEGREFAFSEGQYGTDEKPCIGYMVRSKKYKLLVNGSFENAMFFDLENDPNELRNLINDESQIAQINHHKSFLIDEILFKTVSRNYCDRKAKQLKDQNAIDDQKKILKDFIDRKVLEKRF